MLKKQIPLKDNSNYMIGGPADYFFEFKSTDELKQAIKEYKDIDSSLSTVFVLGSGTNVLFLDKGFRGLILKNNLSAIKSDNEFITVSSGMPLNGLVSFSATNSLSGFEWSGGLPGTIGGAIRGNAGAFGGEIKDNIVEVISMNIHDLRIIKRDNKECEFRYRDSIFKGRHGEIILSAKFRFENGKKEEINKIIHERIEYRVKRHPVEMPSIGSTFKNIPIEELSSSVLEEFKDSIKNDPFPVLPVAKVLAVAGFKGKRIGGAQISEKHPNFIVNTGNAFAVDVLELIKQVKMEIKGKYDISLEEEITII